jgi:hypothetical protein
MPEITSDPATEDEYTRLLLLRSARAFAGQQLAVTIAPLEAWAAGSAGDARRGADLPSDHDLGSWDDGAEVVFGQASVDAARVLLNDPVQRSLGDFVA